MSRFYGVGIQIEVEVDEQGQICRIECEGQVWESVQETDRWRVDEEWLEKPVRRTYHTVIVNDAVLLLYQQGLDWYMQRMYD